LEKKIIGKSMPLLLASIYEKAARMVIDSYYIPTALEVLSELREFTSNPTNTKKRLLDLGAGPGYLPIEIAKRVQNIQIDGIDPLFISVKIAQKNAERAGVGERVHFSVGDASKLRFHENSYDMIVSTGVLHELKDPIKVLNECYRVLKTGGKVFIHDPAKVSSGIDRKKWKDSLNFFEKIIFGLFTLFNKIKPPATYTPKEAEGMIEATHFTQYHIEELKINGARELKIKLRK
jgi:ubiquinone/menaquinone biosynthesis C-methylase UbiE